MEKYVVTAEEMRKVATGMSQAEKKFREEEYEELFKMIKSRQTKVVDIFLSLVKDTQYRKQLYKN